MSPRRLALCSDVPAELPALPVKALSVPSHMAFLDAVCAERPLSASEDLAAPSLAFGGGGGGCPRALGPGELVEGGQAEYYSNSNRCWIPCVVVHVDSENGAVELDVKPGYLLDLEEQRRSLRPRTRPGKAQLEWVRRTFCEGRVDEETHAIFDRYSTAGCLAGGESGSGTAERVLQLKELAAVGAELDARLGISGAVCALRHIAQQTCSHSLSVDGLNEVFWEMLSGVHREFCEAMPCEFPATRCKEDIRRVYNFQRTLGRGTYGVVKLATHRVAGTKHAVKMIRKQDHLWGSTEYLEVEIEHLRLLDHPNVVKLYEYYEDPAFFFLVMDYCEGGELGQVIHQSSLAKRRLPETFIADVMRQVMMAIAHVHARGIVHLDLKSANIMLMPSRSTLPPGGASEGYTLANVNERPHVMVIDLGVAQIFRPGNFRFNDPMGTPATMAPEVWHGVIHPKADVFSCGVVLFELLSLSLPFDCGVDHEEAVRYWNSLPSAPWSWLQGASEDAISLCRCMLMFARHHRPTASQCLQQPFLLQIPLPGRGKDVVPIPNNMVQFLVSVPARSLLYKSVALSIARAWPANQLPSIRRFFHQLDKNRSGFLRIDQLEVVLESLGLSTSVARGVAKAMDLSCDGTVSWTEFVAACIDLGSVEYEHHLQQVFDTADSDKDGLLSPKDVSNLLLADQLLEDSVVRDVFADLTGHTDKDARLDFAMFRQHFRTQSVEPRSKLEQVVMDELIQL